MIYSFLYVFVFCIALVFIQKLDASISPLFSLIITASIATLFFNIINFRSLREVYKVCWENKKLWLAIMVTILVMWNCTMIAPGLIGASLTNFLYFSWLGMLGFLSLSFQDWQKNHTKFYFALCFLSLIILNICFEIQHTFSKEVICGILLSFIGGTSSFVYFKQSQALAKNTSFSATQILAVRFYLTIIVLSVILPKGSFALYFTLNNLMSLILLAFLSLIIPLYLSQKALEKITAEQHAIINSLCPVITGILQEIIFKDLKMEQMIIYILYSVTIAGSYFISKRSKKIRAPS
jgi:hypothetical protein